MFAKMSSFREIFGKDNWSQSNTSRVGEMLDLCVSMNKFTFRVLFEGRSDAKVQKKLYERDQRVNELEREVRRSVVIHLAMAENPEDVPSALIFMNVVKDVERIGDYIKNLYDVANDLMPEDADRDLYRQHLQDFADSLRDTLLAADVAFTRSDSDKAHGIIDFARQRARDTEKAIAEITRSDLPTKDAVPITLVLRFYKRIFMHLSNIASTVVMPVDKMDFFDEKGQ